MAQFLHSQLSAETRSTGFRQPSFPDSGIVLGQECTSGCHSSRCKRSGKCTHRERHTDRRRTLGPRRRRKLRPVESRSDTTLARPRRFRLIAESACRFRLRHDNRCPEGIPRAGGKNCGLPPDICRPPDREGCPSGADLQRILIRHHRSRSVPQIFQDALRPLGSRSRPTSALCYTDGTHFARHTRPHRAGSVVSGPAFVDSAGTVKVAFGQRWLLHGRHHRHA